MNVERNSTTAMLVNLQSYCSFEVQSLATSATAVNLSLSPTRADHSATCRRLSSVDQPALREFAFSFEDPTLLNQHFDVQKRVWNRRIKLERRGSNVRVGHTMSRTLSKRESMHDHFCSRSSFLFSGKALGCFAEHSDITDSVAADTFEFNLCVSACLRVCVCESERRSEQLPILRVGRNPALNLPQSHTLESWWGKRTCGDERAWRLPSQGFSVRSSMRWLRRPSYAR